MAKKRVTQIRWGKGVQQPLLMSRFALKSIRLIKSETKLTLRDGPIPSKSSISARNEFGARPETGSLLSNVFCEVLSFCEEETEPAVIIRCAYQATVLCKSKTYPSKKTLISHKNEIGAASVIQIWPFIRQYVHSHSLQMGLPPLTLPMAAFNWKIGQIQLSEQVKPAKPAV
jgi:hypothetical protein